MALPLVPDRVLCSVYDLDPQALAERGVRLLLADLDNTLAPYGEALPSPALARWKEALEAAGVTLLVVSNSRKSRRCPDFCAALGVDCVRRAGKPGTRGFAEALERTGCRPQVALMVGDQIFTDVWGAHRAGIPAVLVHPLAWGGNPGRILRYAVETPFRLAGRRNPQRS